MASQFAFHFAQSEILQPGWLDSDPAELSLHEPPEDSGIHDLHSAWRQRYADLQAVSHGHHEVLMRFAASVARREGDTPHHVARIGRLSECLTLSMDQDQPFARLMRLASPLHDIGKIGLPDSLIRKQGPLNDEEWELVRRHPQTGAQMLNSGNVPVLRLAAEIALSHHEKFDGSGYPQGLSGSDIPLAGRIVALVDYFDALTNERPYRNAHSDAEALDKIVSESGRHFDPELIRAFLGARDELIAERDRINGGAMALDALVRQ